MIEREGREPEEIVADLEHSGEKVADGIDEARDDWKAKQADESVPGAQPAPEDSEDADDTDAEDSSDADDDTDAEDADDD
jgi:hypothetical protein